MEEQVYAQLWKLDLQKKEERERIEAEEKRKLVQDTMSRVLTKDQEKNLTQGEKNMLAEQWKREEEQERELERQKFILNRERNLELIRHNEAEKKLRED